jgi:hypothetical protein
VFNFNLNRESRILNQVQEKLMTNNVIVTKVKKDSSIIMIKEEEFGNTINQFFLQNGLQKLDTNPNKNYQNLTYCQWK